MGSYLELDRRFVQRITYEQDELVMSEVSGKRLTWPQVLENRFSIVVAPANYGKTVEMQERTKRLRAEGEAAIFVALRKVLSRNTFEAALEPEDKLAFEAWRENPSGQLTVFVDSLDEVPPGQRDDLRYPLKQVAGALQWPNERVKWVISTRPAVLTPAVVSQLASVLETSFQSATSETDDSIQPPSGDESGSARSVETSKEHIRVFSMVQLTRKQAASYLQGRHLVADHDELLRIARCRGLSGLTDSPGGLDVIAHIDLVRRPPECLTEVFQRVVDASHVLRAGDKRLLDVGNLQPDLLSRALQKLSSASMVCQLLNIEMPEDQLGVPEDALSARLIAGSMLPESYLTQLLTSQLFIDAGLHQVKLYPDELRYFLAAQHLSGLVQSPEQAEPLVEALSWAAPTGEHGVYQHFLPLAGWLATLNPHCREEILRKDPQAVAFFGDLRNNTVPRAVAETALRESIRMLAEQADRLGRSHFILTSENFWQIEAEAHSSLLQELFEQYGTNRRARDALLDIVTVARSDALREQILSSHGGDYSRLLTQSDDVRYLVELAKEDDLRGLAVAVVGQTDANERLVALLLERLPWGYLGVADMSSLVYRQFERSGGGFHVAYALSSGLTEGANDLQLYQLVRSLILKLTHSRRESTTTTATPEIDKERYVELILELLTGLVERGRTSLQKRIALLCLVTERYIRTALYGSADLSGLREALLGNQGVRREMLKLVIVHAGSDEQKLKNVVHGYGSTCPATTEDAEALGSFALKAIIKDAEAEAERASRVRPEPRPSRREERLKLNADSKKTLLGMLPQLRDGSAGSHLAWVARWLLNTNPNSRYGEVHIDALVVAGGTELAQAVREGFSKLWRSRPPTFEESAPRTTYFLTVAGLQGLHFELGDGTNLPPLTDDEVRSALRYAVFEINGYPKWFWPLVSSNEEVAAEEFEAIVAKAETGAVSLEHAEALLMALDDAPRAIQNKVVPLAWKFLQKRPTARNGVVESMLQLAMSIPGVVAEADLELVAWDKMHAAYTLLVPDDPEQSRAAREERRRSVIWASSWLSCFPASFRVRVETWLAEAEPNARVFIFDLAANLGQSGGARLGQDRDEGVVTLGALYKWTLAVVRQEDDLEHPDGEAYSVGPRDNAERFRDSIIPAIASAPSQRAYEVLDGLRLEASPPRDQYIQNVQFEMQERRLTRPLVPQQEYDKFERDFAPPLTDVVSFAMAVHSDLLAVKYGIEKGEFSLRRFFSALSFDKIKTDSDGLALEDDFQALLGGELNHLANGRYSVTLESQTAETTRRDVLCRKANHYASIELKMSERWTIPQYLEALEHQLVGQYMRNRNATTGFFVLVLQREKKWRNPETGKYVDFEGLLSILRKRALELESDDRSRFLRVIGIDATAPGSFRDQKAGSMSNVGRRSTKTISPDRAALG